MHKCEDCKYYIPHYIVIDKRGLYKIHGHCCEPKKRCKDALKICPKFELKDPLAEKETKKEEIHKLFSTINDKLKKLLEYVEN